MYGSLFGKQQDKDHDSTRSKADAEVNFGHTQISMQPMHGGHDSVRASSLLLPDTSEHHDDQTPKTATITSCVINLANTIVGAGMLGLPGAFGGTGYMGGTILIVLGASFSAMGLWLLSRAAQRTGLPSSFYSVANAAVPQYTILIDFAVALKCFGVATGYLITVGDCMVDALDHILLEDKEHDTPTGITAIILSRQFWVVGAVLAVLPVSFYKTLDDLKKASALALVFVFFLAFGIVAYANGIADPCLDMTEEECRGPVVAFTDIPTTVSKLPIFVFAFTCHQNIFPIVNELQQRTQKRLNLVIAAAIGFALILFYTVAMNGYNTFGTMTAGDVLVNYPETFYVTILRMCIAFMLTLHYPLQLDPSRRCIKSLLQVLDSQWKSYREGTTNACTRTFHRRDSDGLSVAEQPKNTGMEEAQDNLKSQDSNNNVAQDDDRQFYFVTIAFLFCSFCIAMVVDDLGVILAMVGATGSTLVSYVLPGLIYIKTHPYQDMSKRLAYLQLGLGCLIMPVALYFVVRGKAKE